MDETPSIQGNSSEVVRSGRFVSAAVCAGFCVACNTSLGFLKVCIERLKVVPEGDLRGVPDPDRDNVDRVIFHAKRHGLNPWAYLTDVMTKLAAKPTDVTPLLPDAWAKQHITAGT